MTTDHTAPVASATPDDAETREQVKQRNTEFVADVAQDTADAVQDTAEAVTVAAADAADATSTAASDIADRITPDTTPTPTKAQEVARAVSEAAQQVPGVYRLGGLAAGAVASMRYRVSGAVSTPGVSAAIDPDGAARVELRLVVSYPAGIPDVVAAVREQVMRAASGIVSGPVAIDITVADVHGPFDPVDPPAIEAATSAGTPAGGAAE